MSHCNGCFRKAGLSLRNPDPSGVGPRRLLLLILILLLLSSLSVPQVRSHPPPRPRFAINPQTKPK